MARRTPAGRRPGQALPRRRHRHGQLLHGLSAGGRSGAARVADRGRAPRPRPAPAPGGQGRLGAGGHPRLLEDLHPRRLRRRPLSQSALPAGGVEAGAGLPLALIDLRPRQGRRGDLRPGGPQPPAAAARDRLLARAAGGRELLRARRAVVLGRPDQRSEEHMIRSLVRFLDQRTGAMPFTRKALRYVFPDHWSFLLGEVALYSFVVLVATGIYLTFFFEPSTSLT